MWCCCVADGDGEAVLRTMSWIGMMETEAIVSTHSVAFCSFSWNPSKNDSIPEHCGRNAPALVRRNQKEKAVHREKRRSCFGRWNHERR